MLSILFVAHVKGISILSKHDSSSIYFNTQGVPWRIDEPENLKTFRIGLFGLDKMGDISGTVNVLENALDNVLSDSIRPEEVA